MWNPISADKAPEDYENTKRPHLIIPTRVRTGMLSLPFYFTDDEEVDPIGEMQSMRESDQEMIDMGSPNMVHSPDDYEHQQDKIDNYEPSVHTLPEWSISEWDERIADYIGHSPQELADSISTIMRSSGSNYEHPLDWIQNIVDEEGGWGREPWDVVMIVYQTAIQALTGNRIEVLWPRFQMRPLRLNISINQFDSLDDPTEIVMVPWSSVPEEEQDGEIIDVASRSNGSIQELFNSTGKFPDRFYIGLEWWTPEHETFK